MTKVKKSLAFLLIGALLFSFITVLPSANVTIPVGPIDSMNSDVGIEQIMQAGVEDKSFATAIYDAFTNAGYYGDDSKNVREILGEYTGSIDASNRGIKSIVGIEWLRKAEKIDFSNRTDDITGVKNEISNLIPISIEYIKNISNVSNEQAKIWFGNKRALEMDFSGNPIKKYGSSVGLLKLSFESQSAPHIYTDDLIAIKDGGVINWSINKSIDLPKLEKNNRAVHFSDDGKITQIFDADTTINKDAYIDLPKINDDILEIVNIKNSGTLVAWTKAKELIDFYKANIVGSGVAPTEDWISFIYQTIFTTRIYTPVYTDMNVKTEFKVTKSATCDYSGKKVVGAKYNLHDAETNDIVSDKVYITDQNGEFLVDEILSPGEYYFKEFEAPKGFLKNESKISFTVYEKQCSIGVTGGDKDLKVNVGDIKEDPGTVYIDRFSNNVEVNIQDDENYKLTNVDITYFDRESQTFKSFSSIESGLTFATAEEAGVWASDWINSNKGNSEELGVIDGKVTVKAYFEHKKELLTSDPRPVTKVEFIKVGTVLNNKGEVDEKPLAGATFKLKCTHTHNDNYCLNPNPVYEEGMDDATRLKIKYNRCTDPHTDCGDYLTETGCSWSSPEITSSGDGKVLFENIHTGDYLLTETNIPEGYLKPGTWNVEVNASENTFKITVDEVGDSDIKLDENGAYVIVNQNFNVKVIKIDHDTGETLNGAVFELSKFIQGQWVSQGTATTGVNIDGSENEEGLAYFKKLAEGQYKISEIEAPPGYELITDVIEFNVPFEYTSTDKNGIKYEVSSESKMVTFTVSDKVGVMLPNTGATLTARIATLGIVIMGIMAILLKKTKKDKI